MKKIYLTFLIPFLIIVIADIVYFCLFLNKTDGYINGVAFFDHKALTGKKYDSDSKKLVDEYTFYYETTLQTKTEIIRNLNNKNLVLDSEATTIKLPSNYGKKINVFFNVQNLSEPIVAEYYFSHYLFVSSILIIFLAFGAPLFSKENGILPFFMFSLCSINSIFFKIFLYFTFNLDLFFNTGTSIFYNVLHVINILVFLPLCIAAAQSYNATAEQLEKENKRKQLILENTIVKDPYSWNLFSCIIALIVLSPLLLFFNYSLLTSNPNPSNFLPITIFVVFPGIFLYVHTWVELVKTINTKMALKKALMNSIYTSGKIIGYCDIIHRDSDGIRTDYYYLVISYYDLDEGTDIVFTTPRLSFSPSNTLCSRDCDIYKYKDRVFAWNFLPKNSEKSPIYLELKNDCYKNSNLSFVISIIIATIIMAIISFVKFVL